MRLNLVVFLFQGNILQEGDAVAPTLYSRSPLPLRERIKVMGEVKAHEKFNI